MNYCTVLNRAKCECSVCVNGMELCRGQCKCNNNFETFSNVFNYYNMLFL